MLYLIFQFSVTPWINMTNTFLRPTEVVVQQMIDIVIYQLGMETIIRSMNTSQALMVSHLHCFLCVYANYLNTCASFSLSL